MGNPDKIRFADDIKQHLVEHSEELELELERAVLDYEENKRALDSFKIEQQFTEIKASMDSLNPKSNADVYASRPPQIIGSAVTSSDYEITLTWEECSQESITKNSISAVVFSDEHGRFIKIPTGGEYIAKPNQEHKINEALSRAFSRPIKETRPLNSRQA